MWLGEVKKAVVVERVANEKPRSRLEGELAELRQGRQELAMLVKLAA